MDSEEKKRVKCDYCEKSFDTDRLLLRHIHVHIRKKTHKCDYCNEAFYTEGEVLRHMHVHIHTSLDPFQRSSEGIELKKCVATSALKARFLQGHKCEYCGKIFSPKSQLTRHMYTHTGEKPFKCNECDKTFSRNDHLKKHAVTHSDEKPFQCDKCSKAFARVDKLRQHRCIPEDNTK